MKEMHNNFVRSCRAENSRTKRRNMRTDKKNRMMAAYNGFTGHQTINHITSNIPTELINQLTGKQLGLIMSALNQSYHQGRASKGNVEMIDKSAIWIGALGKIYELDDIKRIEKTEKITKIESIELDDCDKWSGGHGKYIDGKYYQLYNQRYENGKMIADGKCTEEITNFI